MCFLLSLLYANAYCKGIFSNATCYYENDKPVIVSGIDKDKGYAWAVWEDKINSTGTSHITIETNPSSSISSKRKLFCAGYVDGFLMQERIWNRWMLQKDILDVAREKPFEKSWTDWLNDNINYTRSQIKKNPNDAYWKSIGLIISEFDGLVAGYNKAIEQINAPQNSMDEMDFWILQSIGDIYDLKYIWDPTAPRDPFAFMECSGLVRLLPDYSDVLFGHDTWSDYRKMSNTVKEYIFNGIDEWNNKRMEVSTKIGALPSSEDFWITSNGLLIMETTLNNLNTTLQKEVVKSKNTLLTWIRNYHASWVSDSGEQWADEFLRENSGTYNNQYIIVDSKKITPNQKPTKDLMWVTETMPGIGIKRDVTERFAEDGFFPSFNIPYFPEIFEIANYTKEAELKNTSSYYNNPRYLIFKKYSPDVKDMNSFGELLRRNKYKTEEFSHDPGSQIFSRYDLREDDGVSKPKAFGGLDTKMTSAWRALSDMSFSGIWSPKYEDSDFEPWDFESEENIKKFGNVTHDGLPARWNFTWQQFKAQDYDRCGVAETKADCHKLLLCGWCTYDTTCYAGTKSGPALGKECIAGWSVHTEERKHALAIIIPVTVVSCLFCIGVYAYNIHVCIRNRKQQAAYAQIN